MKTELHINSNLNSNSLKDLAEEYFMDLKLRNRTPATLKTYRWYVDRFLKYLSEDSIEYPEQITKEVVKGYQLALYLGRERSERLGSSRVNYYLGPVKCFLRFLKEQEILGSDPGDGIRYAREARRLPREILSADEMVSLIEAPDITSVLGYRDRTVMELLYSTGIRRNECRYLTVPDVDFAEGLLRVFGKGRKERMTPVGRIALTFLKGYVRNVRPLLIKLPQEDHLFLTIRGRRMGRDAMGDFIKKYVKQAGITKRVTPHTFRHTCATLMLRNRADVRHIQELLGHESLESTQIYTHVSVTDLREVLLKYHPREQG